MAFDYEFSSTTLAVNGRALHARWARSFTRLDGETRPLPYGSAPWPAALALLHGMGAASWNWSGARVVEVGCGIGLGAVFAAMQGARALAADGHDDMARFVEANARLNGVDVEWRHWDHARPPPDLGGVDVLLGSDLLYGAGQLNALLDTVDALVAGNARALLADPGRRSLFDLVDRLRARGFTVDHRTLSVDGSLLPGASDVLAGHPPSTGPCHLVEVRR